jgi:hypothetical protein
MPRWRLAPVRIGQSVWSHRIDAPSVVRGSAAAGAIRPGIGSIARASLFASPPRNGN